MLTLIGGTIAVPSNRLLYSGRYTLTIDSSLSTSVAIQVPMRPRSLTDFFWTRDPSRTKSPCILALTPVAVKESMERLVGSKTRASFTYSSTMAGVAKPRQRIAITSALKTESDTIVAHLLWPFPLPSKLSCIDGNDAVAGDTAPFARLL